MSETNQTLPVIMLMSAIPPFIYECAFERHMKRTTRCQYPGEYAEKVAAIFEAAKVPLRLHYAVGDCHETFYVLPYLMISKLHEGEL